MRSILSGITASSATISSYSAVETVCFSLPKLRASMVSTVSCPVKALVEATPISGPTCMYVPVSVVLAMEEPTALTIPKIKAPLSLARLIAAKVSAVSPDWEMAITTSWASITGFR
ncbi:hypothetical protein SDC9_197625 [bioreactor metagenome]|uniref:Uncharacterized protein n=1 Tax=bioreactor metagenome TaxID=1076179 RepID=A0A645IFW2_9ZZZZ